MSGSVVVTGLGLVSPVGIGVESAWEAVTAGRSGIRPLTHFDASALPTRIGGEVVDFRAEEWMDAREVRRNDRFIHFALAAAELARRDAGLEPGGIDLTRVGVIVGSGMGGLATIEDAHGTLTSRGHRKVSPFFVPSVISNLAPGQISIRYGFRGPNFAPVSACATGNHSIGEAMLMLERGMADVIFAGGTEATLSPLGLAGFVASRAMSERNDHPAAASRPFDLARDGFVPAEGAGILVLERLDHAERRGARIYARLSGYGASADAHHVTSPAPQGEGAQRAMKMALRMASLPPDRVGYVNAHATSTAVGDLAESQAIEAVFGSGPKSPAVSSTKSVTGHMLGAAGGAEAIFSVMALHTGVLPPTANLEHLDPAVRVDVIGPQAREQRVEAVLSNGFGFGGTNASLVFQRL